LHGARCCWQSRLRQLLPLATATRPQETAHSRVNSPEITTLPTVLMRSISTHPAIRTRPTVRMHSKPTPVAIITQPTGAEALGNNTTGGDNTANGEGAL